MNQSRTKNSIFNISTSFFIMIVRTIVMFITRTIFIRVLGEQYLGLNGLLTNMLSMLSIAELGIGAAISFCLYKPLASNNTKKIDALMTFYRKMYAIIGIVIFSVGILLIPFLNYILKDTADIKNLNIIYMLYLINTSFIYFVSYKEVLIIADQKKYKLAKYEIIFDIVLNVLQIIILILFKNFILYLIIQLVVELLRRFAINKYISKEYSNITFKSKEKLDKSDSALLKKNVKAMLFHKIGDYSINGTDNIIMTKFVSLSSVAKYSNYLVIINMLNSIIFTIYNSLTSSLGNLIVKESPKKSLEIYNITDFIGFCIYGFCSVCLFNLFNPFIKIWAGENYLFSNLIVFIIVINFYMTGMRLALGTMKSAAGLYSQDKYLPIIQAIVNIISSIILAKYIGTLGVLMGTLISSLIPAIYRPYIVYKHVFKKSPTEYYIKYIKYFITFFLGLVLTNFVCSKVAISNEFLNLLLSSLISSILYIIYILVICGRTVECKYLFQKVKDIFLEVKNAKKVS